MPKVIPRRTLDCWSSCSNGPRPIRRRKTSLKECLPLTQPAASDRGGPGANPSQLARNALKQILLGKAGAGLDDREITIAALSALIENIGPEADAIVYTVLTVPHAVRPSGRGPFSGEELQRECLKLVRGSASPALRARLAKYVAGESSTPEYRKLILPMLLDRNTANLQVHAVLALSGSFDAAGRITLQRQLLMGARNSMDVLSGAANAANERLPPTRTMTMPIQPSLIEVQNSCAAEALWGKDFVGQLAAQLEALDGPDQQPDLFALATSLPFDETRTVVRKKLSDAWHDGVALSRLPPFTSAGICDPGMLLVLKSLPREDVPRLVQANGAANSPKQQRQLQERKAKAAWMSAVQALMTTLMRRFESAAAAASIGAKGPAPLQSTPPAESVADLDQLIKQHQDSQAGLTEKPPQARGSGELDRDLRKESDSPVRADHEILPISLPANAELESKFNLRWPEQLEGRIAAALIRWCCTTLD